MKYLIYCRVSQDREDRQILSPQSQKKELLAFAKEQKLNVVDIYTEKQTAYKTGRPKFNEMLTRIEAGEADGIIVYHLSRVARNTADGGRVIYMMDEGKIKEIKTPDKTYTNHSNDKFFMQIDFAMNKKSSDDNSAFVKRDNITKLEKGELPGKARRGYLNINKDGVIVGKQFDQKKQEALNSLDRPLERIEKDPILSLVVREIIEMALTGQFGLNALRTEAYRLGLASNKGTPLSKSSIRNLLSDSYYYGEFEYAGKIWIGSHEPLMTRSEFERLQDIISNRTRPKHQKREYVFSMMLPCPYCGHLMGSDHQKGHDYLRCTKAKDNQCEFKSNIRQDHLETQFIETLKTIEIPAAVVEYLLEIIQQSYVEETERHKASVASVNANIGRLKAKQTSLTQKWASTANLEGALLSDEMYADMKKTLDEQIELLKESLVDLEKGQLDWTAKLESFFKLSKRLVSTFERSSIEDKRVMLELVGSKFILTGQQLSVELAEPFSTLMKAKTKTQSIRTTQKLVTDNKKPLSEEEMEVWQAQ